MSELAIFGGNPLLSLQKPHANRNAFTPADCEAITAYLQSPRNEISTFDKHGIIDEYERELQQWLGRKYCMLTNSGTNALLAGLCAIGIKPGDQIIASTYTFQASATPALQLGADILLADVEPDTGNISPDSLASLVTERTKAVVVTHQWGHPVAMDRIREAVKPYGVIIIEDFSLAQGATFNNKLAGSLGDMSFCSLGSTKMLSGGQGGALFMDDDHHWERANLFSYFGPRLFETVQNPMLRQFADSGFGFNFRIHNLAAVVSQARFRKLDELIAHRHERYNLLSDYLSQSEIFTPPVTREHCFRGAWHGYVAQVQNLDDVPVSLLAKALNAEGLDVKAGGYYPLLHRRRLFQTQQTGLQLYAASNTRRTVYKNGQFPIAEAHSDNSLAFPLFLDEDISLIEMYGEACLKVAKDLKKLSNLSPAI